MAEDKPSDASSPAARGSMVTILSLAFVTMFTMVGFAYMFSMLAGGRDIDTAQMLKLASAQYVSQSPVVAGELAAKATLDEEDEDDLKLYPLQQFLIGAGLHAQARQAISPRDRHDQMEKALPYLQRANDLGFPDGRAAEGHQLLGETFHDLGRHTDAARHLQRAVDLDLTLRASVLPLLARSLASSAAARPDEALATITTHLDESSLDNRRRSEAELLRIELLNQLQRFDDALPIIGRLENEIQPEVADHEAWAMQLQDRLELQRSLANISKVIAKLPNTVTPQLIAGVPIIPGHELSPAEQKSLNETVRVLDELQREAAPQVGGKARLLAAQSHLLLNQLDLALGRMTQARQQRPFDANGLEGGVSELELLASRAMGIDVSQTAQYLIREIGQSQHLEFSESNQKEFSQRIITALAALRLAQQFEPAIETAKITEPVLGSATSNREAGIAYRDWGDATLAAGVGAGGEVSRDASELARLYFRGAGDAFADAAKAQFDTPEYVNTLWLAIESYQKGRHFTRSIRLLEDYLRYEDRGRIPRGLVAHGRALLADGKAEEAIDSLQTCIIEYDRDPLRYDARLLAAQAAADMRDHDRAQQWLNANLEDGQLTPQSPAWRDSLFLLGEMMFDQSVVESIEAEQLPLEERIDALRALRPNLELALRKLDQGIQRYWPMPRTQLAAISLAEGRLMLAKLPEAELELPDLLDAPRRELNQKANLHRQAALDQLSILSRYLSDQKLESDLGDQQRALLRNALIGQADILRDMGRYAEAAEAYRNVALRYMNEPPTLEAMLGQSHMMSQIGRQREADLLIRQAAVILDRISPQWDDEFEKVTRYDRAGWERYLTWMNERLDQGSQLTNTNPTNAP